MALRKIKGCFKTIRDDIGDLITRRALPTQQLDQIDPFLFLNHHGPQTYPPNNHGLPFGPHPHRGFETVTFILSGELTHRDTGGHESVIRAGGVQWMTAGSGLVHSELSPEGFKQNGGDLEILQLWVNLPSRLKMTKPKYVGLQRDEIPVFSLDAGKVQLKLISGEWSGKKGPIESLTEVQTRILELSPGRSLNLEIASHRNIFLYVVDGQVTVNGVTADEFHLLDFENDGDTLKITSPKEKSVVLLCDAEPLNEPVVSYGPFVMNSREEIIQAMRDYEAGRFG